jgi:hypothetical protein
MKKPIGAWRLLPAMEAIETPDTSAIAHHREGLHREVVELILLSRPQHSPHTKTNPWAPYGVLRHSRRKLMD